MSTKFTAARQAAKLTQAELAAQLGVTQQAVSEWERGQTPRDPMKVRIAAALDADPNELFRLEVDA